MAGDSQDKTEQATPRRLQEARKKGQVAKSTDLNGAILLLIAGLYLLFTKDGLIVQVQKYYFTYFNSYLSQRNQEYYFVQLMIDFAIHVFAIFIPLLILLMVVALGVNLAQVGFMFSPEAIKPKFDKLNPLNGLKNMFGSRALFELVKSLMKIIITGWVIYTAVKGEMANLLAIFHSPPQTLLSQVLAVAIKVLLWGATVYLGIALLDLLYQRYAFKKQMKMSKQEVKDEFKQSEGDPQIKGWLKRQQRQLLSNLVRKEVPQATVVVTNPTHYAVALKYEQDMDAPLVVAKGADQLAKQIREIAGQHDVPVIENVEVARFLYANVEIGQGIPIEMYKAVAEILAMVFRLKNQKI
ncbi:flagellar biosynthesis protein FlhB [Desulforamulus aeronauticus]|uniref:Flagellar biosynthetic protein FlhB n=1 Tax=Desulforamulus aeronauticus DSM 10349 TaxID=1121421 RepID=A0A1M6RC25_9FIRM|nr:flagellar biosynthesis protein FlhB [Desulforamulus aeronauticus]SHK30014.1 flagellar biosynthetic protein FlhB [Desulforamulus aeronauticus DSM 10349]